MEVTLVWRGAVPPLLAVLLTVGCQRQADTPPPSTVRPAAIPAMWRPLGLPSEGLVLVSPDTDAHGFYADYHGDDREALLRDVSRRLLAGGYTQSCTSFEGYVIGFSKGSRQLAVKVDAVGVLALSVFDAEGKEPLLHGVCFGRYHAGPTHILDAKEKEALIQQLETGTATASPPPSTAPLARH